jgi:hypothetical protein
MEIKKCYDYSCRKCDCFIECDNMLLNILLLEKMEKVLTDNEYKLNTDCDKLIYDLKCDFQKQYKKLYFDFTEKYNAIIGKNGKK